MGAVNEKHENLGCGGAGLHEQHVGAGGAGGWACMSSR